jgi:hypothetical protein
MPRLDYQLVACLIQVGEDDLGDVDAKAPATCDG